MRVSASYNRWRVRIVDNAKGEYFLYTRPFGQLIPRPLVVNGDGHVEKKWSFAPYLLATSVMPDRVYIICETGKDEPR